MINTVSLGLAKRLKKAGFPQKTEFYWILGISNEPIYIKTNNRSLDFYRHEKGGYPIFAAPTAEEIIRELPIQVVPFKRYNSESHMYHSLEISRNLYSYTVDYRHEFELPVGCFTTSYFKYGMKRKVLANVCGDMWLYLKKEGFFDENREHAKFATKDFWKRPKP